VRENFLGFADWWQLDVFGVRFGGGAGLATDQALLFKAGALKFFFLIEAGFPLQHFQVVL
jgi:hypothetical protein